MDIEAIAIDSPMEWVRIHVKQYLESDGADVNFVNDDALILLYTKGRKSGQIRRIALLSTRDGDDLLVMASKGGSPVHPEWYLNLVDDATVWVRDHADFYEATAAPLDPEERSLAWQNIVSIYPFMADLEAKTDRVIPVVRLSAKA